MHLFLFAVAAYAADKGFRDRIDTQHSVEKEMMDAGFKKPKNWKGGGNPWVNGHIRYCLDP